MCTSPDPLSEALLHALLQAPHEEGLSVPNLGKRLGLSASVLMRQLALMGDAALGGVAGPGWVQLAQANGRWVARLTPSGRVYAELLSNK